MYIFLTVVLLVLYCLLKLWATQNDLTDYTAHLEENMMDLEEEISHIESSVEEVKTFLHKKYGEDFTNDRNEL